MVDPTETVSESREALEAEYGRVWDTTELEQEFDVIGFFVPISNSVRLVSVRRRSNGVRGSLAFQHSPRIYFDFVPE